LNHCRNADKQLIQGHDALLLERAMQAANSRQQDLQAALAAVPWLLACSVSGGLKCVDA